MSNPTIDLFEALRNDTDLKIFHEGRKEIEAELDSLAEISGSELAEIWKDTVSAGEIPESRPDVIDDIMASKFGKEYKKYLKGEVGLEETKEQDEEVGDTNVPEDTKPAELVEEPDLDCEDVGMEDGEKEANKKKQDGMDEISDKDLKKLMDKNINEDTDTMDARIRAMFSEDKVDVLQAKYDRLSKQAREIERQQSGTPKSSRGYILQAIYSEMDKLERQITNSKRGALESKVEEAFYDPETEEFMDEPETSDSYDVQVIRARIADRTGLQGYFPPKTTFQQLVSVFGEPTFETERDKIQAWWNGKINGTVFTIYDYKETAPPEDLVGRSWHIGGYTKKVVPMLIDYFTQQVLFESKQPVKESLHICNDCAKTFRSKLSECIHCKSKNVEKILESYNPEEQDEMDDYSYRCRKTNWSNGDRVKYKTLDGRSITGVVVGCPKTYHDFVKIKRDGTGQIDQYDPEMLDWLNESKLTETQKAQNGEKIVEASDDPVEVCPHCGWDGYVDPEKDVIEDTDDTGNVGVFPKCPLCGKRSSDIALYWKNNESKLTETQIENQLAIDRMVDLGMSSLADFGDNVERLMDHLMSKFGHKLDDIGWMKVEEELTNYVGSFEDVEESSIEEGTMLPLLQQLKMGIEIEKEHTDNEEVAKKIAMDHLEEDPEYYTKLKKMEAGGCDEGISNLEFEEINLKTGLEESSYDYSDDIYKCTNCGYSTPRNPKRIPTYKCKKCGSRMVADKSPAQIKRLKKKYGKYYESKLIESQQPFITDFGKSLECVNCQTKEIDMVIPRYGVWKESDYGKQEVVETSDDLQYLMKKYNISEDKVVMVESKLNEFETKDGYNVKAKGIVDKNDADELARKYKGTVIQDEEDETKFAVITKVDEGKVNEDTRRDIVELLYSDGYAHTGDEIDEAGNKVLVFTKNGEEIKVTLPSSPELDETREDEIVDIDSSEHTKAIIQTLHQKWNDIAIDYMEAVTGANMIRDPEKRARKTESGSLKGSTVQSAVADMIHRSDFYTPQLYTEYKNQSDKYLEKAFPSNENYSI